MNEKAKMLKRVLHIICENCEEQMNKWSPAPSLTLLVFPCEMCNYCSF